MIQYPNEKDPQSDWVDPGQQQQAPYATPYPPPQNPPYAPAAPPPTNYAAPYQPPSEAYLPPQGPPPDYAQASHAYPDTRSHHDQKSPSGPAHQVVLSPPPSNDPYYNPYGAPQVPDAGPSSSSAQDGGMSLGTFFGNKGPPAMWHRTPPAQLPYNTFPPMCLYSNTKELGSGFPELPPPCQLNLHPFATHDVTEEDWRRFLLDVKKTGSLSPTQRLKSGILPAVMGLGLIGGIFMSNSLEKRMKYNNRTAAGDVIDHWNHYFFRPRRMEVVLCQASERLSGKLGAAPVGDPYQERMALRLRRGGDDPSSDSSSDDDRRHGGHGRGHINNNNFGNRRADMQVRPAARWERREMRKARRAERRGWKASGDNLQPYQLFVTATN